MVTFVFRVLPYQKNFLFHSRYETSVGIKKPIKEVVYKNQNINEIIEF